MERELRHLRRATAHTATEEKEVVTAAFDQVDKKYEEVVKILQAQIKSYSVVIADSKVQFAKLQKKVDEYTKYVEDLEFKATVRGNLLQMNEKILVRAFHLELHAEYTSLGFPQSDVTPPNLTFRQWCHWYNVYGWCTDEEDLKKNEELQKIYWDHAEVTGDFRIPSVRALFNGVLVPHPPGPVTNSRPFTPCATRDPILSLAICVTSPLTVYLTL
jgi:hypothetical protein